jgi:hypothetical protein
MYHRLPLTCSLGLSLALIVGCGGPKPPKREYADVAGKVTYKGQPLKSGTVTFQPAVGMAVVADIKPDGNYSLKGVIGLNTVMISNRQPDPGPGEADPEKRKAAMAAIEKAKDTTVPDRFGTPGSGLKFEVKAGSNKADFDVN